MGVHELCNHLGETRSDTLGLFDPILTIIKYYICKIWMHQCFFEWPAGDNSGGKKKSTYIETFKKGSSASLTNGSVSWSLFSRVLRCADH